MAFLLALASGLTLQLDWQGAELSCQRTRVQTPAETENVSVTLFGNKTMSCHAMIMIDMLDFSSMVYCQFY